MVESATQQLPPLTILAAGSHPRPCEGCVLNHHTEFRTHWLTTKLPGFNAEADQGRAVEKLIAGPVAHLCGEHTVTAEDAVRGSRMDAAATKPIMRKFRRRLEASH